MSTNKPVIVVTGGNRGIGFEVCRQLAGRGAQVVLTARHSEAGKEAVGKALGCGVRFTWREVEIVGRPKPGVRLSGRTAAFAEKVAAGAIDLSLTHSREIAAAVCVVSPRELTDGV